MPNVVLWEKSYMSELYYVQIFYFEVSCLRGLDSQFSSVSIETQTDQLFILARIDHIKYSKRAMKL